MKICGVDPGKTGGMVLLNQEGSIADHMAFDDVTPHNIASMLRKWQPYHVMIEAVGAMPGQGVVSMFTFGRVYGEVLGIVAALEIPHTRVRPHMWTKMLHIGASGTDSKARSAAVAAHLFPGADLRRSERCRKPHPGLVAAALIAEYGRRSLGILAKAEWRGHL